jgi:hypothetical protein
MNKMLDATQSLIDGSHPLMPHPQPEMSDEDD